MITKLNFHHSLFQSSESHDPSEIILICWFFSVFFDDYKFKRTELNWIEIISLSLQGTTEHTTPIGYLPMTPGEGHRQVSFHIIVYAFMHLADAFIQSDLQCIQVIHLLSVCVFPGNWTHNLCAANTMLYHWATGTCSSSYHVVLIAVIYIYISAQMNVLCYITVWTCIGSGGFKLFGDKDPLI